MKNVIRIALVAAVMLMANNVNARSWRVCSKPEAGADFLTLKAAAQSNSVFSGDTIYLDPGHYEGQKIDINKQLTIIGPGYLAVDNGVNLMNAETATIGEIHFFQIG